MSYLLKEFKESLESEKSSDDDLSEDLTEKQGQFKIYNNDLNVYNINEYSSTHVTFNANEIMSIPVDRNLNSQKIPGYILITTNLLY
jgi:hypothetical protein